MTDTYEKLMLLLEEATRKNEEERERELAEIHEAFKKGVLLDESEGWDKCMRLLWVAESWRGWHEQMGKFKAQSVRFSSKPVLRIQCRLG